MAPLVLLLCAGSASAAHPAANHRGVWTAAPKKTPSTMVPDGPIAANGDMGVGVGDAAHGNQSYFFGKMDFWSANAFDGSRYEWTHVAPAFIELSFASVLAQAGNHTWSATQELYKPSLNTTLAAGTAAEVQTSAVFAPETNVMTVRLRSAAETTLTLRLSTQLPHACSGHTSCMADLPMTFDTTTEAGGGTALTMQREANHWVNNEAVLVECDPELIPTVGERRFDVAATTGDITLHGGTQPGGAAAAAVSKNNIVLGVSLQTTTTDLRRNGRRENCKQAPLIIACRWLLLRRSAWHCCRRRARRTLPASGISKTHFPSFNIFYIQMTKTVPGLTYSS